MELRLAASLTDQAYNDMDGHLRRHSDRLDLFRGRNAAAVTVLEEHLLHLEEMVCAALEAAGSVRGERARRSALLPER
jgi:hypothetical protein